MKRRTALIRNGMITILTLLLAGCGTSGPGSATPLGSIVGTDLIGALAGRSAGDRPGRRRGICAGRSGRKRSAKHGEGR